MHPPHSFADPPSGTAAHARVPPLAGALNFRDMGGYRTGDGGSLRWNRLYRSGSLHAATDEDIAFIASKGIRCAHDFRSTAERRRHPNRLEALADVDYWFRDHDQVSGDFKRMIQKSDAQSAHTRALMIRVYQGLPHEFRDAYRELFSRLADGRVPLVFNCTAGKDRTGVAAALVLTALGVPRDTIVEDYLLSERFLDRYRDIMLHGRTDPFLGRVAPELWEPLIRADVTYLDAMFDQVKADHGSTQNYLRDELGVDAAFIARMRGHLVENV